MLTSFLSEVSKEQEKSEHRIFQQEVLSESLSGVQIPLVTITNFESQDQPKKTIMITGRVHPGETQASWILHFFMRFLLSKSPVARLLRSKAIFKIVPMINVDGVIGGNYRTGFAGLDINRMFGADADSRLTPESVKVKEAAK